MKRTTLIFSLFLLLCLFFSACKPKETTTTIDMQAYGKDILLTLNKEEQTISDSLNTYHYQTNETAGIKSITIIYPDKSTYSYQFNEDGHSTASWSDSYNDQRYLDGGLLISIIEEHTIGRKSSVQIGGVFVGLLLTVYGLFNLFAPEAVWKFHYGWAYKDAEPGERVLPTFRVIGVLAALVGVVVTLLSL